MSRYGERRIARLRTATMDRLYSDTYPIGKEQHEGAKDDGDGRDKDPDGLHVSQVHGFR